MRWSKNRVRCSVPGSLVRGRDAESGVVVTGWPFDRTRRRRAGEGGAADSGRTAPRAGPGTAWAAACGGVRGGQPAAISIGSAVKAVPAARA
ncbi:hypothetical protein GCM10010336_64070 [Streptomyces goshikiensis]|nr:hypothetical protein GCM10010336_64070 [Streptomyces goshikiensis]